MLLFEYDLGWLDVFDFDEYVSACCTWPVVCRWMEHSNTADYAVTCAWHCMMRVMRRIRLQTTEYLIEHNFHIVSVFVCVCDNLDLFNRSSMSPSFRNDLLCVA